MRLVLAMLKHETNTFSPVATDIARFAAWSLHRDEAVVANYEKTAMPIAAYLKLARDAGAEIATPIAAEAMPSGRLTAATYEELVAPILAAIEAGCDGAMLDLHGAMVCEHTDDGEGTLLERIRALRPGLPIAVTCDLHANLSETMVRNCTALIGYKTYPHVDMYEVAEKVGRVVLDTMAGRCKPVMAWGRLPLLSQTLRQGTDDMPMKGIQALATSLEGEPRILCATAFGGFPMADIPIAGNGAVVVADGDGAAAAAAAQRLLDESWAARTEFMHPHERLRTTVMRAKALNSAPIVLLDHADNVGSGGTSDVMTVISEVLRQDLQDVAVATVWDPAAVATMAKAGLGAQVTLPLGGCSDMPSIGLAGKSLVVTGRVRHLADGRWRVAGPMYTGVEVNTGPTAVIEIGTVRIVVVSRHHEPWDVGIFTANGIDPTAQRFLLLKSRIHYRAGFAAMARATFTLDGEGVTTSDNGKLAYRRLSRPIYPLDPGPFPEPRAHIV